MTTPQQTPERLLAVIDVDDTILDTSTAMIISEQSTHVFKIFLNETQTDVATVEFSTKVVSRPGLITLPLGSEAMVLRVTTNVLAATSLYLVVAIKDMEAVEKALLGLAKDFSTIKLQSRIEYVTPEEGDVCCVVTKSIEIQSISLQAVWLNLEPYMKQMESKNNLTIYRGV